MRFYRFIQGDCLKVLPLLEEESINLIVTSPPYNIGKNYGEGYDDAMLYSKYLEFLSRVWKECYRVLAYDGRICVNVGDINKGFFRQPTHSHIISQLEKEGFRYRDLVVWDKSQVRSRTAWGSFCSPSNPYLVPCNEFIIIFSKTAFERYLTPSKPDIKKEEFINWSLSIWRFAPETGINWHPSPFPVELPYRCIKFYSFSNDVILDPFLGSGTTMLAARKLQRSCIGIEINSVYIKKAKWRVGYGQKSMAEEIEWITEVLSKNREALL